MNWQQIQSSYEGNRGVSASIYRVRTAQGGQFYGMSSVVLAGNLIFGDDCLSQPRMKHTPLVEVVDHVDTYVALPSFAGIRLPYLAQQQRAVDWAWGGTFIYASDEGYPFAHPLKLLDVWNNPHQPNPFLLLEIMELDKRAFFHKHFTRIQLYRYYVQNCARYDARKITIWNVIRDLNHTLEERQHTLKSLDITTSQQVHLRIQTDQFIIGAVADTPREAYREAYARAFRL